MENFKNYVGPGVRKSPNDGPGPGDADPQWLNNPLSHSRTISILHGTAELRIPQEYAKVVHDLFARRVRIASNDHAVGKGNFCATFPRFHASCACQGMCDF